MAKKCDSCGADDSSYDGLCSKCYDAQHSFDDSDNEYEPDEYEAFDCHMGPDGLCGAAGSEDCEFECPYRRDQYARERAAKEQKRSKGGRQPDLQPTQNGEKS
jgi:hypothetical protein